MRRVSTRILRDILFLLLVLAASLGTMAQAVGSAWGWGSNSQGQLGNGTIINSNVPVQVSILEGATAIGAGTEHSLAVSGDGTVWAWGYNQSGQLGNGTNTSSRVPVQVPGLMGCTSVAGGYAHSLALKGDGTVWAWGYNGDGELGDGSYVDSNVPVKVQNLTGVIAIAAGYQHSLALKNDHTIWAWGSNEMGQLGDGSFANSSVPVQVAGLTGIAAIAAGSQHSLAVAGDGTLWAFGWNGFGQLGNGTFTNSRVPVQVLGLTGVTAVAGGYVHSLAVKDSDSVWAWGSDSSGQLGDGSNNDSKVPVRVSGLRGVTAVAAGGGGAIHSLALKIDHTVWAWGNNVFGQLGNGTNDDSNLPIQVPGLAGVTAIAGGFTDSFALYGVSCPSITVLPGGLPCGMAGTVYNQAITAIGGTACYTFAVTGGSLPTGLSLTSCGLLSGMPTMAGTFNFTVTAVDAFTCTGSRAYSVAVVLPPVITSVTKLSDPFRLDIKGVNFHSACTAYIGPSSVPQTTFKSNTQVIAKSGSELKAMLPEGVAVQITVRNEDDGGISAPYTFVR